MKEILLNLISEYPRHAVKMINKRPILSDWVENNCDPNCTSLVTKIHTAIHDENILCPCGSGKERFFISLVKGLGFCGPAGKCNAARESVSSKCREAAKLLDKESAKIKRAKTNLAKYGHENVGQSEKAKDSRKEFYDNPENIEKQNQKYSNTFLREHTVSNGMQIPGVALKAAESKKENMTAEYGRPHERQLHYSNETWDILCNKELFAELLGQLGRTVMAEKLCVSLDTISRYHHSHNLNILGDPSTSSYEIEIAGWLSSLGILFKSHDFTILKFEDKTQYYSGSRPKELDFYFPEHNFAIEFQGDAFHMNPRKFGPNDIQHKNGYIAKDIWGADKWKYEKCCEKGIYLMQIWEYDWNKNKNTIKEEILKHLNYDGIDDGKLYQNILLNSRTFLQSSTFSAANASLTPEIVLEIRNTFDMTLHTYSAFARKYNVSETAIRNIILRMTWRHI